MPSTSLPESLHAVEVALDNISAAMVGADAVALEQGRIQLQNTLTTFVQVARTMQGKPWPTELLPRIQAVSNQLSMQRDQLARIGALVDRQVASLLPPAEAPSTYGKSVGGARIYRSAT